MRMLGFSPPPQASGSSSRWRGLTSRRSSAATLALVATLGFAATAATTPASAGTCATGRVCMWEDPNFSGSLYVNVSPSVYRTYEIDWWNGDNEISSVVNNSRYAVRLIDGDHTDGPTWNRGGPRSASGPHRADPRSLRLPPRQPHVGQPRGELPRDVLLLRSSARPTRTRTRTR